MLRKLSFIIGACCMILVSCKGEEVFFEENKIIADKTWNVEDTAKFTFEVTDTNTYYDFYLNLRNTSNYEYSNFYAFYKLHFPNGKSLTDTAQFILAMPDGKWLGKSVTGSIIDNSMLFSQKRRFPLKGTYTFAVIHGMRTSNLEHISDVGFKVKQTNEQ